MRTHAPKTPGDIDIRAFTLEKLTPATNPRLPNLETLITSFSALANLDEAELNHVLTSNNSPYLSADQHSLLKQIVSLSVGEFAKAARVTEYDWKEKKEDVLKLLALPSALVICVMAVSSKGDSFLAGFGITILAKEDIPDRKQFPWQALNTLFPNQEVARPIRVVIRDRLRDEQHESADHKLWRTHKKYHEIRLEIHKCMAGLASSKEAVEVARVARDSSHGMRSAKQERFQELGASIEVDGKLFDWIYRTKDTVAPPKINPADNRHQEMLQVGNVIGAILAQQPGNVLLIGNLDRVRPLVRALEKVSYSSTFLAVTSDSKNGELVWDEGPRTRIIPLSTLEYHPTLERPTLIDHEQVMADIPSAEFRHIILCDPIMPPNTEAPYMERELARLIPVAAKLKTQEQGGGFLFDLSFFNPMILGIDGDASLISEGVKITPIDYGHIFANDVLTPCRIWKRN